MIKDWGKYPDFIKSEFDCKETGENMMLPDFLGLLQSMRDELKMPFVINSGYRSRNHSVEKAKAKPGAHTYGVAADIAVSGPAVIDFIYVAQLHGVRRIGVKQHGPMNSRFIHIDLADRVSDFMPGFWSYA